MAVARWSDIDALTAMKTAIDGAGADGRMIVCKATAGNNPVTRAEAITALLAEKVSPTLTLSGAAGSPEVCTITAAAANAISASGDAVCIALIDAAKLWFVTTCTLQALVSGGTVDIPEWTITAAQPTAP
jgi:hypothetical protein